MQFDWLITIRRSAFIDDRWDKTYSTVFRGTWDEAVQEARALRVYPDERMTIERWEGH